MIRDKQTLDRNLLLFSFLVLSNSLLLHKLPFTRLPWPSVSLGVCSNSRSLSQLFNHLILCHLLLLPSIFPSTRVVFSESALLIKWPKYWSFSFSITPSMNIHGWFPLGLVRSIFSPRESQEFSPAPQFESINSSALSLLFGPNLTSIQDYWKNLSFDYADFCPQRDVSAF